MTFNSVYEITNNLTTIAGQHMIDYFSGSSPDTKRWGFGYQDSTTGNTAVMADSVDGGLIMTSGTAHINQALYMSFMNGTATDGSDNGTVTVVPFRPFAYDGSVMIAVWRQHSVSVGRWNGGGLAKDGRGDVSGTNMAYAYGGNSGNFYMRTANNAGSQTDVDSGVLGDIVFNTHKVECKTSSANYTLNGVMVGTSTTNLPEDELAPMFNTHRQSIISVNYCEAWNT